MFRVFLIMGFLLSIVEGMDFKIRSEDLFQHINQRLSWMENVAAYKYQNNLPVCDEKQEKVVLEKAKEQANEAGLDGESVMAFIQVQMDVAKDIQNEWINHWKVSSEQPNIEGVVGLDEIRSKLGELNTAILSQIKDCMPELAKRENYEQLKETIKRIILVKYVTDGHNSKLLDSLIQIEEKR